MSGEDFKEVERTYKIVKIERRPLGSELYFEIDMGMAELHLNLCSLRCMWPKEEV